MSNIRTKSIIIKIECDNEIKDNHESENQNVSYDYIIKNDKDNKKLTKSNIELPEFVLK